MALFQALLPLEFFWAALKQAGVRENNRVYHSAVVVWLMICQRLRAPGTLESAVLELRGLSDSFWPHPCKRLEQAAKEGGPRLSSETGAFNKARHELSRPVVEHCYDHAFTQEIEQAQLAPDRRPAFFFDGTTMRMPHSEELVEAYPPTSNQHGVSHWPILRMLAAHDLYTGLALRPQWGAVNGKEAVSEQGLLERLIDRLPNEAIVVADANFGVFSVAYAAQQRNHPVVLRLTTVRALHLSGGSLQDGTDRRIQWKPTREDRRSHPDLPPDASVSGRLIVRQVQPSNGDKPFLLALFTTLEDPAEQVVELYGKRWNMEVDLRSLKATLRLEELTCESKEMVAKEIDVAMLAYNLVRAVICRIALEAGVEPRVFSFTKVKNVLQAFLPRIAAAVDERTRRKLSDDMEYYLKRCQLRKRKRPSYPRRVWPKPRTYPSRQA
ncbi:MAG: IS4 family transposase [Acidobacteria bacterium]|nr:IS4 family transposase [Acidobacteriota bacterium]